MCYVGSSIDIYRREYDHIRAARKGSPTRFHSAIREFGRESFDLEILRECPSSELIAFELVFISLLGAASVNGFNTLSSPSGSHVGIKLSPATRARIGASNIGKHTGPKHGADARRKMSVARSGVPHSPSHVANQAAKLKGRKFSDETRAKMSASARARGYSVSSIAAAAAHNKGRKQSAEFIEKRIFSLRGRKRTEEQKARMRKPHNKRE